MEGVEKRGLDKTNCGMSLRWVVKIDCVILREIYHTKELLLYEFINLFFSECFSSRVYSYWNYFVPRIIKKNPSIF